MKTIVFIRSSNIYDDSRATKEIMALAELYSVVVLGWNRNGEAEKKAKKVFSSFSNVKLSFFDAVVNGGIGFKNIGKLLKWFRWVKIQLDYLDSVSAIHACDLDSGFIAYRCCKKKGIPLVYDIFDYYVDSHYLPRLFVKPVEKEEIKVINYSSMTIICTEERKEQIMKSKPQKTVVIHNSPDVNNLYDDGEQYDYVYCGAMIQNRLIKEVLNEYRSNYDLKFLFAGYGVYSDVLKEISSEYSYFSYVGTISYSEVLEYEKKSICLSAIYEPSLKNHRLCAPNKFYEAMALGKPIIVCKGTGIDKIVKDEQIGVVINYKPTDFYNAVRYFKEHKNECKEMGSRARKLYEKKYKWTIMKDRLLNEYETLL